MAMEDTGRFGDEVAGRAKEAWGKLTGDERLEAEGRAQHTADDAGATAVADEDAERSGEWAREDVAGSRYTREDVSGSRSGDWSASEVEGSAGHPSDPEADFEGTDPLRDRP